MFKKLLIGLFAVIIVGGSAYWYFVYRPKASTYQAVFLSNGQVYFGKLSRPGSEYPTLTDIHYLVIQKPLQQAAGEAPAEGEVVPEGSSDETETEKPQYTLVKLGKELHGPKDEMRINQRHILFYENLKDDSKVVTAIKESKSE
ncbi:hypothetical protein KKB83_04855 [Patescibacteria group bacterium]|nr:hypothetical protein [Patescibacteria group bacterium]